MTSFLCNSSRNYTLYFLPPFYKKKRIRKKIRERERKNDRVRERERKNLEREKGGWKRFTRLENLGL